LFFLFLFLFFCFCFCFSHHNFFLQMSLESAPSNKLIAIDYERGRPLRLLDQRALPETRWVHVSSALEGAEAVRSMIVRGAPALAIASMLSLAVEAQLKRVHIEQGLNDDDERRQWFLSRLDLLVEARPTAVNLPAAAARVRAAVIGHRKEVTLVDAVVQLAESMLDEDVAINKRLAAHGADAVREAVGERHSIRMLTHCNTGSLATAGYGTALGVARTLNERGVLERLVATETRPYLQGARLTAYECVVDALPGQLIPDSAAAFAMAQRRIDAVVVGADRVAANGDTANKIGTYMLAVCAHAHQVPFFVASPMSTLDVDTPSGSDIVIEQRAPDELKSITRAGVTLKLAPDAIDAYNPAFDVTPAHLIAAIITEHGLIEKNGNGLFDVASFVSKHQ
jgi:methylthioribose-1-phosphate isomerase